MALIRFTATIDTDDLDPSEVDLSHPLGLSERGFNKYALEPYRLPLQGPDFALESIE